MKLLRPFFGIGITTRKLKLCMIKICFGLEKYVMSQPIDCFVIPFTGRVVPLVAGIPTGDQQQERLRSTQRGLRSVAIVCGWYTPKYTQWSVCYLRVLHSVRKKIRDTFWNNLRWKLWHWKLRVCIQVCVESSMLNGFCVSLLIWIP